MDTSNLLKLDNPDCKQYMDLQFDMGNVYRLEILSWKEC